MVGIIAAGAPFTTAVMRRGSIRPREAGSEQASHKAHYAGTAHGFAARGTIRQNFGETIELPWFHLCSPPKKPRHRLTAGSRWRRSLLIDAVRAFYREVKYFVENL